MSITRSLPAHVDPTPFGHVYPSVANYVPCTLSETKGHTEMKVTHHSDLPVQDADCTLQLVVQ